MTDRVDLGPEVEKAVLRAYNAVNSPLYEEELTPFRDLARKVAAITREQDAKVAEAWHVAGKASEPEPAICGGCANAQSIARAIREQATHD